MTMEKIYSYDNSTPENWKEFVSKMNAGEALEIDESMYFYWLEVLPPANYDKVICINGKDRINTSFGFREGFDNVTYFFKLNGKLYCWKNIKGLNFTQYQ